MEKILIIGELSELEKILQGNPSDTHQVQFCGRQLEDVQAMTRIVKPSMLIVCPLDGKETDREILDWIRDKSEVPVLLLTTSKEYPQYRDYMEDDRFDKVFSPFTQRKLQLKCREILKANKADNDDDCSDKKKKILVVDDGPLMLRKIKNFLKRKYDVILATSGKLALDRMLKEEPDLVLLDYQMPGMDGKEVFEKMLADNDLKHIPVIFLTSVSTKEAILPILKLNPAGYILKPPDRDRLMKTIQSALKQ